MKEKLIIRNFGPIKDVELELGRFNVLIGENGTGKSTVAKVLAVCRYFSYLLDEEFKFEGLFENGLLAWGLNEYSQNQSFIRYECNHYEFEAIHTATEKHDNDRVKLEDFNSYWSTKLIAKSDDFKKLLEVLLLSYSPIINSSHVIPSSFYENDVKAIMDNPFYLQPERGLQSIFSLGKSSINNLSDALFNQLAEISQISQRFAKDTLIEPLDIYYKSVRGQGFVRKVDSGNFYSVYNAASGYKSTIPVVLILKYYIEEEERKRTFIVEEPELNLFPTAQNKLMQYLVDKTMNCGNKMLLTTHSPYTLTSLNNMMYAYELGQKHGDEVQKVMDKKYWLNPSEVSAYMMKESKDGAICVNIIDKETGLIMAEVIDTASDDINSIYDNLSEINFG